jgi:hypothetical protein
LLPDDQVHPDTHVLTMVNNVIGVVNYVIAARPSLRNFMMADNQAAVSQVPACPPRGRHGPACSCAAAWAMARAAPAPGG